MKWSKFNIVVEDAECLLLFNSLTGCLVSLDEGSMERVWYETSKLKPELHDGPASVLRPFREMGFLVPKDTDELSIVRARNMVSRFSDQDLFLSVLPGLSCNCRCSYCFEEQRNERMGPDTVERVVKFVSGQARKYKNVHVDWYGGEPLLYLEEICALSREFARVCDEAGCLYSESMTTNGYLLDQSALRKLSETRVQKYQITIDGPPDVHDKLRPLAGGGGTYHTILRNIDLVTRRTHVYLRVNVLPSTVDRVFELLELVRDGVENIQRVHVSVKAVVPSAAGMVDVPVMDPVFFAKKVIQIYERSLSLGFEIYPGEAPFTASMYCPVDSAGQFIVGPSGRLFKCGERFGPDEAVGYIDSDGSPALDELRLAQWIGKDAISMDECSDCGVLPLCHGGCTLKRVWKGLNCCLPIRYCIEDYVRLICKSKIGHERGQDLVASSSGKGGE